jgi:hypothetical protein
MTLAGGGGSDYSSGAVVDAASEAERRVTLVAWAADGGAFAAATAAGDVHVVSRVGRLILTQPASSRPRGARGQPAGVALANAPGGGWELMVVAGDGGGGGSGAGLLHLQHVHAAAAGGGAAAARSVALPGSPRKPMGVAWDEWRRILAVTGDFTPSAPGPGAGSSSGTPPATGPASPGVGLWRYGGGGAGETPVLIASVPATGPGPAAGRGPSAGALGFLAAWMGAPPPRCHVALRCGDGDSGGVGQI